MASGEIDRTTSLVRARLRELCASESADPGVIVALSGGLDSCVLLHALRFGPGPALEVSAAHFDHAMREGSAADAAWVRGLCRAWGVPLVIERAVVAPTSEDAGRALRYDFLERAKESTGAAWIATAHHADDQAETVLFRVLRGTGLEGLAGIPPRRDPPGVVRPLLELWREDLEAYAARSGLRWREDPTNGQLGYARNVIRHELLPRAEAVAPGARGALVRLAALATAEIEAWDEAMGLVLDRLTLDVDPDGAALSVDRRGLAELGESLRARVVRALAARLGHTLDRATTLRAVDFAAGVDSGKRLELGRGIELLRERTRTVVSAPRAARRAADPSEELVPGGMGGGPSRGGAGP